MKTPERNQSPRQGSSSYIDGFLENSIALSSLATPDMRAVDPQPLNPLRKSPIKIMGEEHSWVSSAKSATLNSSLMSDAHVVKMQRQFDVSIIPAEVVVDLAATEVSPSKAVNIVAALPSPSQSVSLPLKVPLSPGETIYTKNISLAFVSY